MFANANYIVNGAIGFAVIYISALAFEVLR
jgi:hypothetical protein